MAGLIAGHADSHAGDGERDAVIAAVIGGAGLAWGNASLERTGVATITVE